jgi:hypothetical protein
MKLSGFGYKTAWFAVRTADTAAVAAALGLEVIEPCTWSDGMEASYARTGEFFVTPCVDGWTFCVGTDLFPLVDRNEFGEITRQLSAALQAEAQFFATYRVAEAHAWARATPERLVRAYAYCGERGETSANFGPLTPQELSIGPRLYDEHSPAGRETEDLRSPNEDDVMRLAGLWSVDPTSLENREVADATGLRARYPRHGSPGRLREGRPWWQFWRRPRVSS